MLSGFREITEGYMQKTIYVIEQKDNFGEFQPQNMSNMKTESAASALLETIQEVDMSAKGFRIVKYVRQINRS
jgi:hypothetical protein